MSVARVRAHHVRLPFKRRYRHALADRTETEGVVLEVALASGHRGFGEALPRSYVTGETIASTLTALRDIWNARWRSAPVDSLSHAAQWLESFLDEAMQQRTLALQGAVELAVLDAVGQATGASVSTCFAGSTTERIYYTGPIGVEGDGGAVRLARRMRLGRLRDVKVKVGYDGDVATVRAVRNALGPKVDLRVDANGIWPPDIAIERIRAMSDAQISGVEQPVAAEDTAGAAAVQAAIDIPVIADESACTVDDVRRLAEAQACRMINVRVGKCGGMLGARRVAMAAEQHGLAWHIGSLVGETALLSAAGRHLAFGVPGWRYVEGSYGPFLLKGDIARPQPRWGWRGSARRLAGPGLGVSVDERALAALTIETRELF